jgi:hypothetical protein
MANKLIPIDQLITNKRIATIKSGALYDIDKCYAGLGGCMKWSRLSSDHLEPGDTAVFHKWVDVPHTIVEGGRAGVEVHVTGLKQVNKIYIVA